MARTLIHRTLPSFWETYEKLPVEVQELADKSFALLKVNPEHPSLHFKRVGSSWSARVGISYRVLAVEEGSIFYWYWIGNHGEYDKRIG